MKFRRACNLFIILSLHGILMPQVFAQILPFRTYDTRDGLSSKHVLKIIQDRNGYLWLGTFGGGACKFDGLSFTTYNSAHSGLADNVVNGICEDSAGNIWFGTRQGACKYDGVGFTTYTTAMGLAHDNVRDILEDSRGNLWFATAGGVSKYDGKGFTSFTTASGLADPDVRCIYEDMDGMLWFGTRRGVSKFDGAGFTTVVLGKGEAINYVWCIFQDSARSLWFGTRGGGLVRYDGERYHSYTTASGLAHNRVYAIRQDAQGRLWCGTGGGVSVYDGHRFITYTSDDGCPADADKIETIFLDRESNIWIGSGNGGMTRYRQEAVKTFTTSHGLADNAIRFMQEDHTGRLFVVSRNGTICRFDNNRFTRTVDIDSVLNENITAFLIDHRGGFWFGTRDGGVQRHDGMHAVDYTLRYGLTGHTVQKFYEDHDDNIWIGTTGGISKYDGRQFRTYTMDDGLVNNSVRCIQEDHEHNLWLGGDGGVSLFDGVQFTNLTTEDGLVNNWVNHIFIDSAEVIWFATFGGVSRYDGGIFTNYTAAHGLPSNKCNSVLQDDRYYYIETDRGVARYESITGFLKVPTVSRLYFSSESVFYNGIKDSHGHLWFGSSRGVIQYTPHLRVPNQIPPLVHITGLYVSGTDQTLTQELIFTSDMNTVELYFKGLSYSSPENVRYQYRLHGIEEQWIETAQQHVAYARLSPGAYTFQVRARNDDGVWSMQPAQLSFEIRPPFWETWWFQIGSGGVILLMFVGAHRLRSRVHKRRAWELKLAVDEKTQEIKTHMDELVHAKGLLEKARQDLEVIVQDRTQELQKTVHTLQSEVADRRQAEEYLRSLASQLTRVEEHERRRLAEGLHDNIGQSLAMALASARNMLQECTGSDGPHTTSLLKMCDVLNRTLQDVRSLSLELSPPMLYDIGLGAAVQWLSEQFHERFDIPIEVLHDEPPLAMHEDLLILLFNIIRELLVNVVKHSQATHARINIHGCDTHIEIRVSDNGVGFRVSPRDIHPSKDGGFGLFSLRERLHSFGGKLCIDSSMDSGTQVTVVVPVSGDHTLVTLKGLSDEYQSSDR